jgi:hypothetical protein
MVYWIAIPTVTGPTRFFLGLTLLLPIPPIIIFVVTLDLVRGIGRTPDEIFGEFMFH